MLTRNRFASALVLLLLPIVAQALPPDHDSRPMRHYILESDVPLDAAASAELASEGIDVQQPMSNHRYLVRIRDGVTVPHDARIRSMRTYDASQKIARAAYAEAAQGKAFARLRILFQKDVTFDDAQAAIEAVGGTIDMPLDAALAHPQRLTVRIPSSAALTLAQDERVFGVYGPPLRVKSLNAVAAQISNVTPLYSAPYSLNGSGVALSTFEPDGHPDTAHNEFGGRLTSHFDASRPVNDHATHTSGTMIAAGNNAAAKGMSPAATLHAFDANPSLPNGDFDVDKFFSDKQDAVKSVGSVADNNSWDFAFSWQDGNVWYGNEDGYGAYSGLESEPYDAIMRTANEPLIVHAAGNDATAGNPTLLQPWSPHRHIEDRTPSGTYPHTYCYSQNGSGTDCPTASPFNCSAGLTYCEKTKHPTHGANTTIGLMASTKNTVTVGAIQPVAFAIASFSSRGPTTDGRVKPELVAKGTDQFSTFPNNGYATAQGTSMSTPVVTGIAGILTQQYRKTFGKTPSAALLKTLLIAGADDLGNAGPDYTYGFGLADAKASADLIRDDNGTGSRIRTGSVTAGQEIDFPITLAAAQRFRVVLGWFDPEVLLTPASEDDDPLADKTLVNDLDVRVVDPSGTTVLPYVLNKSTPDAVATRGVNHTDTTEEVEIANAVAGTYHVIVKGAIGDARSASQDFVLIANGGVTVPTCTDNYEPNDTQATAFGSVMSGQTVVAKLCSASDVDFYTFTTNVSPISVTVAATDTPLKVTLFSNLTNTVVQTIAPNSAATLTTNFFPTLLPVQTTPIFVKVEANGTVGATGAYTLTPSYTFSSTPRKRSTKH
jgi:subtilisin family serine protease